VKEFGLLPWEVVHVERVAVASKLNVLEKPFL
jgi:hypothetical protein